MQLFQKRSEHTANIEHTAWLGTSEDVTDGAEACPGASKVKSKKAKVKSELLMKENDLKDRLFQFAIGVLEMLGNLRGAKETDVIKYQLSKSATSSGANYEESQAAVSKADFINKVGISLKEMRESNYWLRIIKELFPKTENIVYLIGESEELGKILASILIKSRN